MLSIWFDDLRDIDSSKDVECRAKYTVQSIGAPRPNEWIYRASYGTAISFYNNEMVKNRISRAAVRTSR